jgi:SpoVK/Ycf46/Vps4 family AAA+-type ATPase
MSRKFHNAVIYIPLPFAYSFSNSKSITKFAIATQLTIMEEPMSMDIVESNEDQQQQQQLQPLPRSLQLSTKKDKSNLPWVEKYRPDTLQQLIAHEDIITILNQLIESNKLPHLLFYGPPGTGKALYLFHFFQFFF